MCLYFETCSPQTQQSGWHSLVSWFVLEIMNLFLSVARAGHKWCAIEVKYLGQKSTFGAQCYIYTNFIPSCLCFLSSIGERTMLIPRLFVRVARHKRMTNYWLRCRSL